MSSLHLQVMVTTFLFHYTVFHLLYVRCRSGKELFLLNCTKYDVFPLTSHIHMLQVLLSFSDFW